MVFNHYTKNGKMENFTDKQFIDKSNLRSEATIAGKTNLDINCGLQITQILAGKDIYESPEYFNARIKSKTLQTKLENLRQNKANLAQRISNSQDQPSTLFTLIAKAFFLLIVISCLIVGSTFLVKDQIGNYWPLFITVIIPILFFSSRDDSTTTNKLIKIIRRWGGPVLFGILVSVFLSNLIENQLLNYTIGILSVLVIQLVNWEIQIFLSQISPTLRIYKMHILLNRINKEIFSIVMQLTECDEKLLLMKEKAHREIEYFQQIFKTDYHLGKMLNSNQEIFNDIENPLTSEYIREASNAE